MSFHPSFILLPLPPARPVQGGATDLMISGTVVPFPSTGGRYVTHLSVTLRQRLKFIFRACLKQVTHLLHLLSRDQHWTFLMLMSGIIKCAWVSVCVCVSFACNTQGGPQKNGTGTFTKLLWCHLQRRAVLLKWLSCGFTVDLIGFPFRTRENATPY